MRVEGSVKTLDDLRAIVVPDPQRRIRRTCASATWPTVRIGSLTRYGVVTRGGKGEAVRGPGARPARRQCAHGGRGRARQAGRDRADAAARA